MRRAPIVVTAATAALLALTACSVGEPTEAETDGATDPEASASSEPVDPTDPGCLVGDWRIAQDQMQVFYDAVSAASEGLALTIVGEGVTTGSIGGTWTADAGVITTAVGDNSLSTIVTINGVTQDASDLLGGIIASDPINEAPFDCSDPTAPVLQFDTGSGRVPVALTPAG